MDWLLRLVIYVPVVYLVMIVYAGQHQEDARGALRAAVKSTAKVVLWTVVAVAVMELLEYLFLP